MENTWYKRMITSKKLERLTIVAMLLAAVFSLFLMQGMQVRSMTVNAGEEKDYTKELFDTNKPMSVEIIMDEDQWKDMLDNAAKKQWHSCDVIINGKKFSKVGIKTKGANSLESIAENPNSNRYSFKLKFDKYIENQKCFGLDKLCLNNNYGDATNMKEALAYDMFRFMDANASLYNFAKISVNGNYWGVYLALETPDKAFLERNYGAEPGALFKPGDIEESGDEQWEESEESEEETMFEDSGSSVGGSDLKYIDDNLDSYFAIWQSQVTKTGKADKKRVVEALKHISNKEELDKYMDMDSVLKYMAVHNFIVNYDSLSGDGDHNYYLHEKGGKLSIVPWDYNLSLGAYEIESDLSKGNSSNNFTTSLDVVNSAIDDHWKVTNFFDGILDNEKYRAKYHEYYKKLVNQYVFGGGFESFYKRTRMQIDELVKTDPNALYSYNEYVNGAEMLKKTVNLRGLSVKGQLEGSIPSTLAEQKEHPEKLINDAGIDLKVMGSDGPAPDME